jgi:hypothetical protein
MYDSTAALAEVFIIHGEKMILLCVSLKNLKQVLFNCVIMLFYTAIDMQLL